MDAAAVELAFLKSLLPPEFNVKETKEQNG